MLKFTGQDELSANLTALGSNFDVIIINAISRWITEIVKPVAKSNAPVKTGTLQEAVDLVQVIQGNARISFVVGWGTKAPYGRFQERGWYRVKPKHFVTNALRQMYPGLPPIWVFELHGYVQQLQGNPGVSATPRI